MILNINQPKTSTINNIVDQYFHEGYNGIKGKIHEKEEYVELRWLHLDAI